MAQLSASRSSEQTGALIRRQQQTRTFETPTWQTPASWNQGCAEALDLWVGREI